MSREVLPYPRRIKAVNISAKSENAVWISVPATFSELKTVLCSRFQTLNPSQMKLSLRGTAFDSVDILRDHDTVEVNEGIPLVTFDETDEEWISLNVGGTCFTTTKLTLISTEPSSILTKMFSVDANGNPQWNPRKDPSGAVLIDRSGSLFEPLLNYLRTGRLNVPDGKTLHQIYAEAEFYNFENLLKELRPRINTYSHDRKLVDIGPSSSSTTLSRADVIRALMVTPSTQELRFQVI